MIAKTLVSDLFSLIVLQTVAKVVHLFLGIIVISQTDPSTLGISSLQIPFITMMFTRILKECFHRFILRNLNKNPKFSVEMRSLWQAIPIVIFGSSIISIIYAYYKIGFEELFSTWALKALICWLINSWIEFIIEPVIIYLEFRGKIKVVAIIECSALLSQSIFLISVIKFSKINELVLPVAQLGYSLCLLWMYYAYATTTSHKRDISIMSVILPKNFFEVPDTNKILPWFIQSIGKYITTEGEHILLFLLATSYEQGIYEFVLNLGSIVPRILFSPIERIAFLNFQKPSVRNHAWKILLSISILISLTYLVSCPNFIYALIYKIYGEKWAETSAPSLLSVYGIYLLVISINGLVESLRDAVATDESIKTQNGFIIFSVFFYFSVGAISLYCYGALGLILASIFSTLLRLYYNQVHFHDQLLSIYQGVPSFEVWFLLVFTFFDGIYCRYILEEPVGLIIFGGIPLGLLYALLLFMMEEEKFKEMYKLYKESKIKEG